MRECLATARGSDLHNLEENILRNTVAFAKGKQRCELYCRQAPRDAPPPRRCRPTHPPGDLTTPALPGVQIGSTTSPPPAPSLPPRGLPDLQAEVAAGGAGRVGRARRMQAATGSLRPPRVQIPLPQATWRRRRRYLLDAPAVVAPYRRDPWPEAWRCLPPPRSSSSLPCRDVGVF